MCHAQLAFYLEGHERQSALKHATESFNKALELSGHLWSASPAVLRTKLEWSEFMYDFEGAAEKACRIAKEAFDSAIDNRVWEAFSEEEQAEVIPILKQIRSNLSAWTADIADEYESVFEKG